uniref:Chemosensory protein 14 n=1 Tax=Pieris rapae TaxID=64459 RepID=A0A5B8GX81_PIERA|nr:chemosensory protein 14 [Pieris rapae]
MTKIGLLILITCIACIAIINSKEIKSIEDLDLVNLLKNEKERKHVFACLMEQAPCGDMQQFKESISQMIKTSCQNCPPQESEKYNMFSQLLAIAYPDKLKALKAKYQG